MNPTHSSPTVSAGSAAAPSSPSSMPADEHEIRAVVREKYGAIAQGERPGCCSGDCCTDSSVLLSDIGYTADQLAAVPEGSNLGLGCGNPLAHAEVRPGETVLDLGSGAGIDCFLAGKAAGLTGRAIGVDMTPAMIQRARGNAARHGHPNVEFRLGEIEHLPVGNGTIDVVISNCVINLSPDKPQAFREAFRALKPGGRMVVSDLVWLKALPDAVRRSADLYVGCIAGASMRDVYLGLIREAGFTDVEIVEQTRYPVAEGPFAAGSPEREALDSVASIKVRARKA